MQSLIDTSDDEIPSSGAKDIQVEIGQIDHEAMSLKMPVSQSAASQENDCGVHPRDNSAPRVVEELGAEVDNFDPINDETPSSGANDIQVEVGQIDHEVMFLMPVSQSAGSQKNDRGVHLGDNSAPRVVEELGAEVNNFDPINDETPSSGANDIQVEVGQLDHEAMFLKMPVTQTDELGDYFELVAHSGPILRDNSPTVIIEEMGGEGGNFGREKARNAILEYYDPDPNGNDITGENIKQLEDGVQGRRHKRSVGNMFKRSRAVEYPRKHCLKSKKEDFLVSDSPSLENPNPRKKKSRCAIL